MCKWWADMPVSTPVAYELHARDIKFVSWDSKTDLILMLCSKNVKNMLNGPQSNGLASAPAQNLEPDGLKIKGPGPSPRETKASNEIEKPENGDDVTLSVSKKNLRLVQNKDQLCLSWIKNTRSCQLPISPLEQFILLL